jgi:predicted metal-dependent peptidase
MTKYPNKAAHTAMLRARLDLMLQQPFFGCLALQLELVEADQGFCNTMATDGKRLLYYPDFVLSLQHDELTGVVAHEVHHCCYKHMTRRGHRDPRRWNIAGDFLINDDLKQAGFKLPGPPVGMDSPPGLQGHLYDPQFKGMSTEEIYERLPEPKIIKINGCGVGQGDGNEAPDPGRCGGVIDAAPGHDKAANAEVEQDWDANVKMAVAAAKRQNAGTLPAYLQRLVKELQKPKVNWRDLTRQFIDGVMTRDYSWQRPNQRYVHSGLILPTFIPDALHHLVFFGDVSGSISPQIMKAYVSEIQGALDDGVADQVTALYFDTEIKKLDTYLAGDLIDCDVKGGGGTDFRPMFEWALKEAHDASCIVVLTDMYPCSWELPDPGIPVLWGAYLPEENLKQIMPQVPFSDGVVHIDSSE